MNLFVNLSACYLAPNYQTTSDLVTQLKAKRLVVPTTHAFAVEVILVPQPSLSSAKLNASVEVSIL